jgi:hypothetical protein
MEGCLERWPASRANRSHARWRAAAAVALVSLATMAAASPAKGTVTIGQLPPVAPSPSPGCSSTADYLQPSVTGGELYIAREAGTITSWSTLSSGSGATYVFKVFRRTSDPDDFQVIAQAPPHTLSLGLNIVPVDIGVRPGDMIGLNESDGPNSCTFPKLGDAVLRSPGSLSDGEIGTFAAENDVRLNLSAVLDPSNDFTVGPVTRDRQLGTATVIVYVSNPGLVAVSGKGLKKRHASKTVAVAGPVQFQIASAGSRKRRLEKTGKVTLIPTLTFYPTGGNPASKAITIRLKKRRSLQFVQSP